MTTETHQTNINSHEKQPFSDLFEELFVRFPHLEAQVQNASVNSVRFTDGNTPEYAAQEFEDGEREEAIQFRTLAWIEYLQGVSNSETFQELFGCDSAEQFTSEITDPSQSNLLVFSLANLSALEIDTLSVSDMWRADYNALLKKISENHPYTGQLRVALALTMLAALIIACSTNTKPEFTHIICSDNPGTMIVYQPTLQPDGSVKFDPTLQTPSGSLTFTSLSNTDAVLRLSPWAPSGTSNGNLIGNIFVDLIFLPPRGAGPIETQLAPLTVTLKGGLPSYQRTTSPDNPDQPCVGVIIP